MNKSSLNLTNKKIGIGIDTGGTYTDAVIYDFTEEKVIAAAKALTTRRDLSIGIMEALSRLPEDYKKQAALISLSTTLATNACVENRGGRAKLIFFGGDENVINEWGVKCGLPPAEEIYIQESYTKFSGETEREPDWDLFGKKIGEEFNHLDGAGIVEIYAIRNAAVIEKKAAELFRAKFPIPVVCGHELFSDLNCLQRASGTLLNARLFPVIREFLEAIKRAMDAQGLKARTVVVRSDCSLMSEEFAHLRPVETLHSGPAASISGGIVLSGERDCVVIDMGGTTTDIALVRDGSPGIAGDGISVGKWKTFVKGFDIKTIGLGGDSAVHYDENNLFIEEYRAIPLCVLAQEFPEVTGNLQLLAENHTKHSLYLHEHYCLYDKVKDMDRYTGNEKKFITALEKGPLMLEDAAEAMNTNIYNFRPERFLADGVVMKAGFTPTDVMHIKNDFSAYSRDASLAAARHIALNFGITVDELCGRVYEEVRRKLYHQIALLLFENNDRRFTKKMTAKEADYFIGQCYESAKKGNSELLVLNLKTAFPLVGLGAPIRLFLDDVARLFGTRAVIPGHYEVANALGAVAGKVRASCAVEIRLDYAGDGITGYKVFGPARNGQFRDFPEAEAFAAAEAEAGVRAEIQGRGFYGDLDVVCESVRHEGSSRFGPIYMGNTVIATASASPV